MAQNLATTETRNRPTSTNLPHGANQDRCFTFRLAEGFFADSTS